MTYKLRKFPSHFFRLQFLSHIMVPRLLRASLLLLLFSTLARSLPVIDDFQEDVTEPEQGDLYEGDIEGIDPHHVPDDVRAGVISSKKRWPKGVVRFVIQAHVGFDMTIKIAEAMEAIAEHTCITFLPRTNQRAYVNFRNGSGGCSSSLGRTGGKQHVNLGKGCGGHGTIVHEIMHALGFSHEQNRPDRNDYVEIAWDNIKKGMGHNFRKKGGNAYTTFGISYDYGSLMHYGKKAFAKDKTKPTIIVKDGSDIGNRKKMSESDIAKMRAMYKCDDTETET